MKYVIANWKANKNIAEAREWIATFKKKDLDVLKGHVEIVICPPYPFIPLVHEAFKDFDHVHAGAQDLSPFGGGSYTGEVAAHTVDGLVTYAIIGHSERRKYFQETDMTVEQKVDNAQAVNIEPLVLVRTAEDQLPLGVKFVVFEPVEAIGSGDVATEDAILAMRHELGIDSSQKYIYGGSVQSHNVRDIVTHPEVDGVLVGGASLDPEEFYTICERSSHL